MPENPMQNRLLSQLPDSGELADYRKKVATIVETDRRRIRVERVIATSFWIFCAISAAAYLWFGDTWSQLPRAPFLACIMFLWGGVEVLKHHIHSAEVELRKEVKQLQVQVLELQGAKERG
ncbi:hypothetical protein Acid345_1824 [Candidatus Koribacter versatilis Ellin345]|uniref:2TM domain-containing protein n=1 Tax=Koribacter versatilis (strain Ellin345) TaxID=204669 RepID=Q1IQM5_KORVE|nr:hypothetical protein [Candidatus Koribacter versatilis]ABF40825.1 hypothetical protein Acid345_1824 [Candidatus Koribacter versatilis Ellin345]